MNTDTQIRARSNELTLLAFMSTVVMLFAAFTSSYLIRRTGADWQTLSLPGIVWFNTVLLLVSSVTMEFARKRQSRGWLKMTAVLGVAFLVGQVLLWRTLAAEGMFLPTSVYCSFLYMLTAVHGAHLLGGIFALLYASMRPGPFGLCAWYWHFVDGVWVYVVLLLYLM